LGSAGGGWWGSWPGWACDPDPRVRPPGCRVRVRPRRCCGEVWRWVLFPGSRFLRLPNGVGAPRGTNGSLPSIGGWEPQHAGAAVSPLWYPAVQPLPLRRHRVARDRRMNEPLTA
jgi:hypothetical protein